MLRQLASNSIYAAMARASGQALMFGALVWLARLLGPSDYGNFAFVLASVTVLMLFAKFGLDTASLRYVATYLSEDDWGRINGLLRRALQWILAGSALIALVGSGIVFLSVEENNSLRSTFLAGWLVLPLLGILALRQSALLALGNPVKAQLPENIVRPTCFLAILGILVLTKASMSAGIAMSAYALALLMAVVIATVWQQRALPDGCLDTPPSFEDREWLRVAFPLFGVAATYQILTQADTIMIGIMRTSAEAGIYSAASRITALIQFGMITIQIVAAPQIATFYKQGDQSSLQRLLSLVAIGSSVVALPLCVLLFFFGENILGLFGPEFRIAIAPCLILAAGQLYNAISGAKGYVLTMTGHQDAAVLIVGASAIINIVLNAVLISRFGIMGAATATTISTFIWCTGLALYSRRVLGLKTWVSWPRRITT